MARARRAKPQPARIVVPLLVVAILAVGGVVAVTQGWFRAANRSTTNTAASGSALERATAAETPSTSTSATPPSAASSPDGRAGQSELKGCRDRVSAGDAVRKAADVGVGHWSEHVQAQTDADAGDISAEKMDAIFKRTRLAGPDDVSAYHEAEKSYDDESGSCDPVTGASAQVAEDLAACHDRSEAQQPVLDTAAEAMADWESHLAAMRRSRTGHVHDAQGVWIKAWRAAPPHIKAYEKAEKEFDAPSC